MNNPISQIRTWLEIEQLTEKKGFFCHWEMIEKAFDEKRLTLISDDDLVVGFLIYKLSDFVVDIKLAEIKTSHRGLGLGRKLVEKSLSAFRREGIVVAELFCSPEESEPFWKKLGFNNFPNLYNTKKIRMYRPLVPTLGQTKANNGDEAIRLWNVKPHLAENSSPKWTWNLTFKSNSNELIKPIVHPAESEWQVSYNGKIGTVENQMIKYFEHNCCEHDDFLIIKSL